MKKIGIMGTHGTGKTTMAFRLANEIKGNCPSLNVAILPEVVRSCPLAINEQATIDAQLWIFHKQMITEIEMGDHDVLVCDRTILDNLAYSKYNHHDKIVNDYLRIAIDWLKTYDKLYLLRPTCPVADDGVRSVDADFQRGIDLTLANWVKEFSINISDREV